MQRRFQEALEPHQVQEGSGEGSRKGSGEVGEALVQSQVRLNRVPKKVPEKAREVLVQSWVRLNRVSEKAGEGLGGFGTEPAQVQQGSGEGSGEG